MLHRGYFVDKKSDTYYGFTQLGRMNYNDLHKEVVDEIVFGIYAKDGGCVSEAVVKWVELCGQVVPHIGIFTDGITAAYSDKFIGVINDIDDKSYLSPEQFSRLLIKHGFIDHSDKPLE